MTLVVDRAVTPQHKKKKNTPEIGNGLIQWIGMDGPTMQI